MPFDAKRVPTTDNKEVLRERFNAGFDELYAGMKAAPSFVEGVGVGLANIVLPDGRRAQLKLTLTIDEDEFCGEEEVEKENER